MNKKIFIFLITLMSISLIGIVSVQIFWIKNAIELANNQFVNNVNSSLIQVSENISERELSSFYQRNFSKIDNKKDLLTESEIKDFIYTKVDSSRQETMILAQTILEENYKVPLEFFEDDTDSISLKKIYSKEKVTIINNHVSDNRDLDKLTEEETFIRYGQLEEYQKLNLKHQSRIMHSRLPIYRRVSNQELEFNLEHELAMRGVKTEFRYGVYDDGLSTRLKSGYFSLNDEKTYSVPLFVDENGNSEYQLYVSFPYKKNYLLSSISQVLGLSILFIIIIILVFVSSLRQMLKQKQISEIKTDFINNMTHEFKTPIATINLALDAIKNPKILNDEEKILRYAQMIRDENKRMHAQVENVLRISKLEKNELDVPLEENDLHLLIDDAIHHINLLLKDSNGTISLELNASKTHVLANQFHMTSVIVNMLENAIKYSVDAPEIKLTTSNTAKSIVLRLEDKGIGMSKSVQKNIFKKFYREETGNVHNVKGHGLGLSYVKKIVLHHQGLITVESEKGKGSTFIVKLPLI